jgi:hypothetical protein
LFLAVLADHCSADDLAHLAAGRRMAEHRSPRLCAEAADQLADLLIAGQRPALGWWRRWRRPPAKVTSVGPIRAEQFVLHEELRVAP